MSTAAAPAPVRRYPQYPDDWPFINAACLERAGFQCQECGARHGHWNAGGVILLSAVRLDGSAGNNEPANLRALCNGCAAGRPAPQEGRTLSCYACGERKPAEEFPRDRSRSSGRASKCRPCAAAARRERRGRVPAEEARRHPNPACPGNTVKKSCLGVKEHRVKKEYTWRKQNTNYAWRDGPLSCCEWYEHEGADRCGYCHRPIAKPPAAKCKCAALDKRAEGRIG